MMELTSREAARRARQWGRRCGRQLLDLVFPPTCLMCEQDLQPSERDFPAGDHFCARCRDALQDLASTRCPACARPVPAWVRDACHCPACRLRPLRLDGAVCLGDYEGLRREAILGLKRAQQEPLGVGLGQLLAERVKVEAENSEVWSAVDLVLPLPTHRWRRFQRWYNPAELLAGPVAAANQWHYDDRVLAYRRRTQKQGTLTPAERRANLRGAMRVRQPERLRGRSVLLIDDVLTSGATVAEAARMCRQAGARGVRAAVVARGVGRVER